MFSQTCGQVVASDGNHFQELSCIHVTAKSAIQAEPPIGHSIEFVFIPC